ncbi:MAG: tetratricopeptide repeat protein, partial [Blastocatellia bacterium]
IVPYGLLVGALFAATTWALLRRKPSAFLGAWFFLVLSVTSSIMPFSDLVFEHRMYLPLAAVVAFVVLGSHLLWNRISVRFSSGFPDSLRATTIGLALVMIVVAILAIATVRRNIDYTSEVSMWSDVVRQRPNNQRAHTNLGISLASLKKTEEASGQFLEALRIDPNFELANYNFGFLLYSLGRIDEAAPYLRNAIRLSPKDAQAHYALGAVLIKQGHEEEGIREFLSTLQIDPDFAEANLQLGLEFEKQGKTDEAKRQYALAARLRPDWRAKLSAHIAALK